MPRSHRPEYLGLLCAPLLAVFGCPSGDFPDNSDPYRNTTDKTNGGAVYVGSGACRACHPDIDQMQTLHGHSQKLKAVQGSAPTYPGQATYAGVPQPPEGFVWNDISYVIGGYIRKARFADQDGYVITTGHSGVAAQWNLEFPANGATAGFVAYESTNASRLPYDYSCFVCHTTGPLPQDPSNPQFQENRPGMAGTWKEAGVQCEACHGPGSRHIPNPDARDLFVDTKASACGECHSRSHPSLGNADTGTITALADGWIDNRQQWPELRASGGHSGLGCVACHEAHASANYDAGRAIHTACTDCHGDKDMGFHAGEQYVSGGHVEPLTCISCHMPFASRSATWAVVGESNGRVGDMRTHIFRINTNTVDYTGMFTADGSAVLKDSAGRAAVTVDFVCLRCHNTDDGYPFRLTLRSAAEIARGIHGFD